MIVHEGRNEVDELPGAAAKIKYEIVIKKQTAHVGSHVTLCVGCCI